MTSSNRVRPAVPEMVLTLLATRSITFLVRWKRRRIVKGRCDGFQRREVRRDGRDGGDGLNLVLVEDILNKPYGTRNFNSLLDRIIDMPPTLSTGKSEVPSLVSDCSQFVLAVFFVDDTICLTAEHAEFVQVWFASFEQLVGGYPLLAILVVTW